MDSLSITLTGENLTRYVEAICSVGGYKEDSGVGKEDFAKNRLEAFVIEVVAKHESNEKVKEVVTSFKLND